MPWNDNADQGPWGGAPHDRGAERPEPPQRPPPAPPPGPDFGEWLRRAHRGWDRLVVQPLRRPLRASTLWIAAGALIAAWFLSGFAIVGPGERAIVTRFGAFEGLVGPGLAYHLPAPIGRIEKIDIAVPRTMLVGVSDAAPMQTADGGLALIAFAVQWRVADPLAFADHNSDPEALVRGAAQAAMREAAAGVDLASLLAGGRGPVQAHAAALTQTFLDRDRAGVAVIAVRIQDATPPAALAPAWQDVAKAGDDAGAAIGQAQAYQAKSAGDAAGEAARLLQAADAYRAQTVLEAQAEAARFAPIDAQYRRAPALTRERLYIQTMQRVLSKARVIVIGGKTAGTPVMLPPQTLAPSAAPASPPASGPSSGGGR